MYVVVDCDGALIWMGIKQKQKKKKSSNNIKRSEMWVHGRDSSTFNA